jgi:molybdate transport system ATP-binding protein
LVTARIHKELITAEGKGALNVDLTFNHGVITSLYGDSGVGKTMTLRMLAGLDNPDSGVISCGDEVWYSDTGGSGPSAIKRKIGFVFQDYGLFPNMSIEENLRYAAVEDDEALIQYYIETFELSALKDNRPATLSGGQKQRTAIARALVFKPKVLLLDEPFTAQDRKMSTIIGQEVLSYTKDHQCVTVLVTHNIAVNMQLTTYIYSINKGEIIKEGSVHEVFLEDSESKGNGIIGVVAEKVMENNRVTIIVLANDRLLKMHEAEGEEFHVGEEVFLKLNQGTREFQLQKL